MPRPLSALALALAAALSSSAIVAHGPALAAATAQPSAHANSYVLFGAGDRSTTMSGSTGDLAHARAQRRGVEPMLFVRQGGHAYVIRDADTLRRAEAIFAPQRELGERQGSLGEQQAALGARQAALGAQQARLGMRQASADSRGSADLGRQQAELGNQQDELGRRQDALGQRQSALGRQQEQLGRVAQAQLHTLVTDAIRRGVAQRVD